MDEKKQEMLIQQLKREWEDDPNVQAIWFGWKLTKGALGDGPAICFAVRSKYSSSKEILAAGSKPIPTEIDGIPTDIYPAGAISSYWTGMRGQMGCTPLQGGGSTGPLGILVPWARTGGTLGGLCYFQDGTLMALSNAHVWGDHLSCEIVQPQLPVRRMIGSAIELLMCGGLPAFFIEDETPTVATVLLSTAAGVLWAITTGSDSKDPHRRGQEATVPTHSGELTRVETVRFEAEPRTLPLPGLPYMAAVAWDYSRQTDEADYPYAVHENRTNEHLLVRHHSWGEEPVYHPGQTVHIRALVEASAFKQPDEFHVVANVNPQVKQEQCTTCVLHPATFSESPYLAISLALGAADAPAAFPIQKHGFMISTNGSGKGFFRDVWPEDAPDGLISLQFPAAGLTIALPQEAEQSDLQVVSLDASSLTVEAFDGQGTKLDAVTTPPRPGVQHLVKLRGAAITKLVLSGGGGKGLLRWVSVKTHAMQVIQPLYANTNVLVFQGRLTLPSMATRGVWKGLLSVQSVDTLGPTASPLIAAQNIGGIESAVLTTMKEPCTICMAMDDVFRVP